MPESVRLEHARVDSPIGSLDLWARGGLLVAVAFEGRRDEAREGLARHFGPHVAVETVETPDPAGAVSALGRYFAGEAGALDRIPADPAGTSFQRRTWAAIRRIPAGTTISYGELAARIGQPEASRAVAQAAGANPVPLFVPCHRVVASTGDLHGYGGGLERKRLLLELEKALPSAEPGLFDP